MGEKAPGIFFTVNEIYLVHQKEEERDEKKNQELH